MAEPVPPWRDLGSEYGRLLALRDRLIAQGVDPDELEMPLPPPPDPLYVPEDDGRRRALRDQETQERSRFGAILIACAIVVLAGLALWLLLGWRNDAPRDALRLGPVAGATGLGLPADGVREAPSQSDAGVDGHRAGRRAVGRASDSGVRPSKVTGGISTTGTIEQTALGKHGAATLPDTSTSVTGRASWYCGAGSRCTRGVPVGSMAAAAGPALRVGDWRGRTVTVCTPECKPGARRVDVVLRDWCFCGGGRVVDLYRAAFSRLGNPSRGILRVEVTWGDGAPATLPPTDTP